MDVSVSAAAPAVSVIIPTYNRAGFIGAAIDSVLAQSYRDVEVIVVDDGSTDDTATVVRAFGEGVRYVTCEHGGVAHARNVGAAHARGRYVAFLDSDDLHYRYTFQLLVGILQRFPDLALVCAEMSGFDDRGYYERYHLKTYHRSAYRDPAVTYERIFESSVPVRDVVTLPEELLAMDATAAARRIYFGNVFDSYLLNLVLSQQAVLYRRDVLSEVGPRNVRVKHWQEVDYLLAITRNHRVAFVDIPTYQLRYHPGQISSISGDSGVDVWIRKQQILLRVIKRHATVDPAYYEAHRETIDRQLAHLHRAVAVPMLVHNGRAAQALRLQRAARLYLNRASRYGHPSRMLQLASRAPRPVARCIVRLVESARAIRFRLAAAPRLGSLRVMAA